MPKAKEEDVQPPKLIPTQPSTQQPAPKRSRVIAIIIKGKRMTYVERKAIEWMDIKATQMIGSENKRNGKAKVHSAYLLNEADIVMEFIMPLPESAAKEETLFEEGTQS